MSDYIIACGGTGGHLAPGIALAERIQERGHSALLLISNKSIDTRLTAKYPNFKFAQVPGAPLTMTLAGVTRFVVQQARGIMFSLRLIRREKPACIVGFGGFTTAAIIVAGWMCRLPVALHEANRVPGKAVRSLARFARRVYLPREVVLENVPQRKVRHADLPVRREIRRVPRYEAAQRFGLDPNRRTIAVVGGSQGASALNRWAKQAMAPLAAKGVQLLVITGPSKGETVTETHPAPDGEDVASVWQPFCDSMSDLLSLADLVVSRSGAGTLAELAACRVPAVLVPYPYAADDHQLENALEFEHAGGGVLVRESELGDLQQEVESLISNEHRLAQMSVNLGLMSKSSTLGLMLEDLAVLAHLRTPRPSVDPEPLHA